VRTQVVVRVFVRFVLRQRFVGAGLALGLVGNMARGALAGGGRLVAQAPFALIGLRLAWECWEAWIGMKNMEEQRKRFANEGESKYDESDMYAGF